MEDVDKLDNIQDGFIHYQLIRFCQATRLQYVNGQITLANQNVLQQHVCQATTSRTPPVGMPPPLARSSVCTGTFAAVRLQGMTDFGGSGTARAAVWRKVGDRFQNIAIISVIPNMVKAGYRG
jgi:hypothetical protein